MSTTGTFRSFVLLLALSFIPYSFAQQGGGTGTGGGTGGGGTGGGSTGGGGGSTGGGTGGGKTTIPGSTNPVTTQNPTPTLQQQKQLLPLISGSVVTDDGSPLPPNIVIERVCGGQPHRETYLNTGGFFSYQIGVDNPAMMDASSGHMGSSWDPMATNENSMGGMTIGNNNLWIGCELRASATGYRSTTVTLNRGQMTGQFLEVGTIIIYPISRIQGTTVSAISLRAPKDAKKALERADKAYRKQKYEEAIAGYTSAVGIYPNYASAWVAMGQAHLHLKQQGEAKAAFAKAIEADSKFVIPYIELAKLANREQNWREMADLTEKANALDPMDFPEAFVMNALANLYLNNHEAAEQSARRAQRLDTSHRFPMGNLILANLLGQKKDSAGEMEQLRTYLKYAPSNANTDRVRGRIQELESIGAPTASKQQNPE